MTLPVFPDISPNYTFEESLQFSTTIIGYGELNEQRISGSSTPKSEFKLTWTTLSNQDKETLQQFFLDRKGSYELFTFNHILPSQVIGSNGANYTCIKTHISSTDNKPITGASWSLNWEQAGFNGIEWENNHFYKYDFNVRFKEDIGNFGAFNQNLWNYNNIELIECN